MRDKAVRDLGVKKLCSNLGRKENEIRNWIKKRIWSRSWRSLKLAVVGMSK